MNGIKKFEDIIGINTDLFLKYTDKYFEYKKRAQDKNIPFSISFQKFYLVLTSKCYICGIDGKQNEIGIDRLNNNKGYTEFNVMSCCWNCNRMKSDMSIKDFALYMKRINPNHQLVKMFKL